MQLEQEKLDMQRKEVALEQENVKQARLSISQFSGSGFHSNNDDEDRSVTESASLRHAAADADTDIGDSVSVANEGRVHPDAAVQAMVREQTRLQVAELMRKKDEMEAKTREEMRLLLERNAALEEKCKAKDTEEAPRSPLALSPPGNATPSKDLQCAASPLNLSPIASTPGSAAQASSTSKQKSRSSRLMGSPSQPERRFSILGRDFPESSKRRLSVAHEAFNATPIAPSPLSQIPAAAAPSGADDGIQLDNSCTNANKNRMWWAEQRKFLMEDLYISPTAATPTPSRGRRLTQVPGQDLQSVGAADSAPRALASEFDEPGVAPVPSGEDAGNIEWVADCTVKREDGSPEESKKQTKMRAPKVHRKA